MRKEGTHTRKGGMHGRYEDGRDARKGGRKQGMERSKGVEGRKMWQGCKEGGKEGRDDKKNKGRKERSDGRQEGRGGKEEEKEGDGRKAGEGRDRRKEGRDKRNE